MDFNRGGVLFVEPGFVSADDLVHYDPATHTKTDLGIVSNAALHSSPSGDVSVALDADLYYDAQTFIKVWGWTTGADTVLLDIKGKGWLGPLSNELATVVVQTKSGQALHVMTLPTE